MTPTRALIAVQDRRRQFERAYPRREANSFVRGWWEGLCDAEDAIKALGVAPAREVLHKKCSFCGGTNPHRNTLIYGNGLCICDACVSMCVEMVDYAREYQDFDAAWELLK